MNQLLFLILSVSMFFYACNSTKNTTASIKQKTEESIWNKVNVNEHSELVMELSSKSIPTKFHLFELDKAAMYDKLNRAIVCENRIKPTVIIQFPNPLGMTNLFHIYRTDLMENALAEKFPELQTFEGQTITKDHTIRISRNQLGVDAMIISNKGTYYIDPVVLVGRTFYIVYNKHDFIIDKQDRFFEPALK